MILKFSAKLLERKNSDAIDQDQEHQSMKVEESESESCSVVSDSLGPHGLYSPWNSAGQYTGVGRLSPSPGDLPNPGIEPRSSTL